MNRRNFLKALAGGAVALALPGQRAHEWEGYKDFCRRCGCSQLEVEEGLVPLNCTGVARRIFLAARPRVRTLSDYLTSDRSWFLRTDHPDGVALFNRAHPQSTYSLGYMETTEEDTLDSGSLSEHSLEELLIEVKKQVDRTGKPLSINPRFVIWRPLR